MKKGKNMKTTYNTVSSGKKTLNCRFTTQNLYLKKKKMCAQRQKLEGNVKIMKLICVWVVR